MAYKGRMRSLRPAAPFLALFAACASSPGPSVETVVAAEPEVPPRAVPPPTEEDRGLAARAWEEAARHLERQAEMLWSLWLGEEAPPTEEPPDFLFEPATARAVERVAVHEDESGRYRRLHAFLAGEVIARATRAEDESLRELRLDLLARLRSAALEPDAVERRRRAGEVLQESEKLVPILAAHRAAVEASVRALGWNSSFSALAALSGAKGEELLALADAVLESTDSLWREAFGAAASREIGLALDEVRREDLAFVFHGAGMDLPLRTRTPEQALRLTLEAMGASLDRLPGLIVDAESREGKEDRSLCLPGPGKARLAIPAGGGRSHHALLADAGCALFFALASREGALLLPEAPAQAFSFLFARISEDPAWLTGVGEMTRAEARARASAHALRRLLMVRRRAAAIHVEHERSLAPGDAAAWERAYARWMSRALGFPVPGAWARLESLELISAADALRGEILAAEMARALGEGWWSRPDALDRLRRYFEAGAKGVEPLLEALEVRELDVQTLVDEIRAGLSEREPELAQRGTGEAT